MSEGERGVGKQAAPGINPVTGQPVADELDNSDLERINALIDPAVLADEVRPGESYDLAGAVTAGTEDGSPANRGGSGDAPAAESAPTGQTESPSSHSAQSDTGQNQARPTPVNPLAAALTLMLASPQHRHLFLADLEWRLLPAIAAGQFRLITKDNRPLAFVTWAFLSDEIRERLKTAMTQPGGAASGAGRLKPEEWRSGKHHVIVDFVSPFITDEEEKKRLLASVFGGGKKEGGKDAGA